MLDRFNVLDPSPNVLVCGELIFAFISAVALQIGRILTHNHRFVSTYTEKVFFISNDGLFATDVTDRTFFVTKQNYLDYTTVCVIDMN